MGALRVRGQEATLQIVIDGDLKGSSFAKVTNFTLTPKQDISETSFLGETEDDFDFMHRGYDFSWTMHEVSRDVNDLLQLIVNNELAKLPHPDVTIIAQVSYRDLAGSTATVSLEQCKIKMDNKTFPGAKDYISNQFSGKCRVADLE